MGKTSAAVAPSLSSTADERARDDRRAHLLDFFANPPAEILAAAQALGAAREHYGDDTDRELADLDAGKHPLQQRGAKSKAR